MTDKSTLKLPKSVEVTLREKDFSALLQHITNTIENHLSFTTDDEVTASVWNDLVCNGFTDPSCHTVKTVSHMLSIMDPEMMTMGNVIHTLFETVNVLKHYYALTKMNPKSVKIKSLVIQDIRKLHESMRQDMSKMVYGVKPKAKVQTTLTQTLIQKGDENSKEENRDNEAEDVTDLDHTSDVKSNHGEVTTQKTVDDEGFQLPKKTAPRKELDIKTSEVDDINVNPFDILADQQEQDVDSGDKVPPFNPTESKEVEQPILSELDSSDVSYDTGSNHSEVEASTRKLDKGVEKSLVNMFHRNKSDDDEIEALVKWIENDVQPKLESTVNSLMKEAEVKAQKTVRVETDAYFRKRIGELNEKIETTAEKSQVQIMMYLNGQSTQMGLERRKEYDDLVKEFEKLKVLHHEYAESHRQKLQNIQNEFQIKCQEYMEDHIKQRQMEFDKQKQSFQEEMNQMKSEMKSYLETIGANRNTLEKHYDKSTSDKMSNTSTTDERIPPVTSSNINVTSSTQVPTPNKEYIHPLADGSLVTVNNGSIFIPKAKVHKSRMIDDGTYDYDLYTKEGKYKYNERFVTQYDESAVPIFNSQGETHQNSKYVDPSYDPYVDSTRSIDSHHDHDSDIEYIRTTRPLMPNQYQLRGQPKERTIQSTQMLRHANDWNLQWTDMTEDPKDFYENLRHRVEDYEILLNNYMDLDKEHDVSALVESDCKNYKNAHKEMSKALYHLFTTYKDKWFNKNPKLDLLLHYGETRDGFGFLKEILIELHPNLRQVIKSETMDKPQIHQFNTWFEYMNQYRKWVDFEKRSTAKRTYTNEEHVSNILKQIEDIDIFSIAKEKIEQKLLQVDADLIDFPEELELHKIGLTIYRWIPEDKRHSLPSFNQNMTINKLNQVRNPYQRRSPRNHSATPPPTRSQEPRQSILRKPQRTQQQDDPMDSGLKFNPFSRQWEDVICSACGQAGHDIHIHGCDNTAMIEKVNDYRRSNAKHFDRKTVLQLYEEHQKKKRERRVSGKYARNQLRRKLRAAKLEMDPDIYYEARDLYIKAFKAEHPHAHINDPRADDNLEIEPYSNLDSESESDGETN